MEKTVHIDGKDIRLRSSAAIPRMYRMKFQRDIIQDMRLIQTEMRRAEEAQKTPGRAGPSALPLSALTLFENVAYLMARHADPGGVPDSVDEWMEGFETFSIYTVFPVIQDLWNDNLLTLNVPKKKSRRRKGK